MTLVSRFRCAVCSKKAIRNKGSNRFSCFPCDYTVCAGCLALGNLPTYAATSASNSDRKSAPAAAATSAPKDGNCGISTSLPTNDVVTEKSPVNSKPT